MFTHNQVAINCLENNIQNLHREWETWRWKRCIEIWIAPKFGCPTMISLFLEKETKTKTWTDENWQKRRKGITAKWEMDLLASQKHYYGFKLNKETYKCENIFYFLFQQHFFLSFPPYFVGFSLTSQSQEKVETIRNDKTRYSKWFDGMPRLGLW